MHSGFFVTGTDTGVGKTLLACALLHACRDAGKRAVGMKPVAAGCARHENRLRCDDVENLLAASGIPAPNELICPYAFEPAIAPHLAARQAGIEIDLARIQAAFKELSGMADIVVVEGVGGFRVPLNATQDTADLARQLGLPVILVVGLRLGCLNHALLTAQAISATGLPLAGWIANRIDPAMPYQDENIRALEERLSAPLLATVGHHAMPDVVAVSRLLPATRLLAAR